MASTMGVRAAGMPCDPVEGCAGPTRQCERASNGGSVPLSCGVKAQRQRLSTMCKSGAGPALVDTEPEKRMH